MDRAAPHRLGRPPRGGLAERRHRGFSLVEVILALGLLAAVLISISSLFVFGRGLLHSGKTHTSALSVAGTILEEMNGWSYEQLYEMYGLSGGASQYTVDSLTNAYAAKWQPALDENMRDGRAEIELSAVAEGAAPVLLDAQAIRIVVTVSWSEGPRARRVRLATVRL